MCESRFFLLFCFHFVRMILMLVASDYNEKLKIVFFLLCLSNLISQFFHLPVQCLALYIHRPHHLLLRILLKHNTALLSTVRVSVCHGRDISHFSHKGINAMSIIRGPIKDSIRLILRCWGKSSMVCQQKSDGLQDALKCFPDSPNYS